MDHVYAPNAPTTGTYSHGVIVDPLTHRILFISGQTGNDKTKDCEPVVDGGVGPQTTQTLNNILRVLESLNCGPDCIVSLDVFLKDCEDRKKSRVDYQAAYRSFFAEYGITRERGNMPARTQVWVSEIPWEYPTEDTVVEIRAIAAIPR